MSRMRDLTGYIFTRLTVAWPVGRSREGRIVWLCFCVCGSMVLVDSHHLLTSNTRSCGCLYKDVHRRHGHSTRAVRSPEYYSWRTMIQRCTNPKSTGYVDYGGRGITVCPEWLDNFKNFLEDMGLRPNGKTLDRVDNDGPYSPSNCIWSTPREQRANQRK